MDTSSSFRWTIDYVTLVEFPIFLELSFAGSIGIMCASSSPSPQSNPASIFHLSLPGSVLCADALLGLPPWAPLLADIRLGSSTGRHQQRKRGVPVFLPHFLTALAPALWQWVCPVVTTALAKWTLLMVPVVTVLQYYCFCFVPINLGKSGKGFSLLLISECLPCLSVSFMLFCTHSFESSGVSLLSGGTLVGRYWL